MDPASEPATEALERYFTEIHERLGDGFDIRAARAGGVSSYRPPNGVFLVAIRDDEVMGCAGLQHLDEKTSEFKRLWVSPASRGLGLGKRLMRELEEQARALGRNRVVLDTGSSLTEAIALYDALDYVQIDRYNDNPCADLWYEKYV